MKSSMLVKENNQLRSVVFCVLFSSSVFSTTFLDPVNWPKQIALFSTVPILVYSLRQNMKNLMGLVKHPFQAANVFILSFLLVLIAMIVSDEHISRKLWGVFGRNNGFVTTSCLLLIGIVVSQIKWNLKSSTAVLKLFNGFTFLAALYGLAQFINWDPVKWNIKDQVFSFYGNTNFASAIFAIGSLVAFSLFCFHKSNPIERFFYFMSFFLQCFICYSTNSLQGILGIVVGLSLLGLAKIQEISIKLSRFVIVIGLIVASVTILGFLGFRIMSIDITQYTLKLRLYYWLAGLKMGLENPMIGVGVDSYGDYFQKYRESEVIPIMGVDLFTNNAHNPFVQSFATMGILGLIAILFPFLVAFFCACKIFLLNIPIADKTISILFFVSWLIAFFSIDNIAIATINWLLLGSVIAMSKLPAQSDIPIPTIPARYKKKVVSSFNFGTLVRNISIVIFFAIAWTCSYPNRALVSEFSNQISMNDAQSVALRVKSLTGIAESRFAREYEISIAVQGLAALERNNEAIEVLKLGLVKFPRDFILLDNLSYRQELIGRLSDARQTRERVLLIEDRNPRVWLNYAYVLQKLDEESKAQGAFLKAVSLSSFMDSQTKALIPSLYEQFGLEVAKN